LAPKERPIAVIAPSLRSIKLYANGRIEYQGKSGSVVGATARVDRSGEKHRLKDTRKYVLRIDGPEVAIAVPIPPASIQFNRYADTFVAQVNAISNKVSGSAPAPAPVQAPAPPPPAQPAPDPPRTDLQSMDTTIGQLERLGKLRDSGVLTEDEFQEQKAALLRAVRNS
jgi:hypothetical protein